MCVPAKTFLCFLSSITLYSLFIIYRYICIENLILMSLRIECREFLSSFSFGMFRILYAHPNFLWTSLESSKENFLGCLNSICGLISLLKHAMKGNYKRPWFSTIIFPSWLFLQSFTLSNSSTVGIFVIFETNKPDVEDNVGVNR